MFQTSDEVVAAVVASLRERVAVLEAKDTYVRPTAGSVVFAGTNGVLSEDNANLFWDDSNNRLGIGTAAPTVTLDVRGITSATRYYVSPGNSLDAIIELGFGNTGNRNSYIDFRADDTYTDYALRIIRNNSGANASSQIIHRGTGNLQFQALEAATIEIYTNSTIVEQILSDGRTSKVINDAVTAATSAHFWYHRTSGTPAASFGTDFIVIGDSNGSSDRTMGTDRLIWATATDASRKARRSIFIHDTAARECLRMEASGTAAMIGFLGAAAIVRPTVTGSRGGNAALASALTALANLGLITDSSTA